MKARIMRAEALVVLVALLGLGISQGSFAEGLDLEGPRWDETLVESAGVWRSLLQGYAQPAAEKERTWPERKERLEAVLREHPEGEYADDVLLAIGCGVAAWEGDLEEAVRIFQSVAEDYPGGQTILSLWHPAAGDWMFDPIWFDWAPGIARTDGEGRVIFSRTFSANPEELAHKERAVLRYFDHLANVPRLTKDLAVLNIVQIHLSQGREEEGLALLRGLTNEVQDRIARVCEADRVAADRPDGQLVAKVKRFEIYAHELLMQLLESRGEIEQAIQVGENLLETIGSGDRYWEESRLLADLCARSGDPGGRSKAAQYYAKALEAYLYSIERESDLNRRNGGSWQNLPVEHWRQRIEEIRGSIEAIGAEVPPALPGIDSIKERHYEAGEGSAIPAQDSELRASLVEIFERGGQFVESNQRQSAVGEIKEAFLQKVRRAGVEEKAGLSDERAHLATAFAELARIETNAQTRDFLLGAMQELIEVRREEGELEDAGAGEVRGEVDKLIAQLSGNQGIANAVPDPMANLADMPGPGLLYASERLQDQNLPLSIRRAVTKALANSGHPSLYYAFADIIQESEDGMLTRFAVRGIERIAEDSDIDENGVILIGE